MGFVLGGLSLHLAMTLNAEERFRMEMDAREGFTSLDKLPEVIRKLEANMVYDGLDSLSVQCGRASYEWSCTLKEL
jgi:hypothetical protein